MELAKILYTFHSVTPPICHGHISSHNIFIEFVTGTTSHPKINNWSSKSVMITKVFIGDIESLSLLKYANLFQNYRICNVWSPPEAMRYPKKIVDLT